MSLSEAKENNEKTKPMVDLSEQKIILHQTLRNITASTTSNCVNQGMYPTQAAPHVYPDMILYCIMNLYKNKTESGA